MAVGESIKSGHDEYRRIFARLFKTTDKDVALREALFTDLARKLLAHHEAEERLVFPVMIKVPDLRDMALDLTEEHRAMRMMVKELKEIGYDHKIWRYRLTPLYSLMFVHWEKEETVVIPFAPEYFPLSALEELGKQFDIMVSDYLKQNPK